MFLMTTVDVGVLKMQNEQQPPLVITDAKEYYFDNQHGDYHNHLPMPGQTNDHTNHAHDEFDLHSHEQESHSYMNLDGSSTR